MFSLTYFFMTFVTMLSFEVLPQIPHERRAILPRLLVVDGPLDRADGAAVEATDKVPSPSSIFAMSVQEPFFAFGLITYTQVHQSLAAEETPASQTKHMKPETEREREIQKGDWLNETFWELNRLQCA